MYFKYVYYFSNWHNSFLRTHLNYTVNDGLNTWDHTNSQHQVLPWRWCQLSTWSDDLVRVFKAVTLNRSECRGFWWVFYFESIFCLHIHSYIAHLHIKKKSFLLFAFSEIPKGQDLSVSMRQHSFQFQNTELYTNLKGMEKKRQRLFWPSL